MRFIFFLLEPILDNGKNLSSRRIIAFIFVYLNFSYLQRQVEVDWRVVLALGLITTFSLGLVTLQNIQTLAKGTGSLLDKFKDVSESSIVQKITAQETTITSTEPDSTK